MRVDAGRALVGAALLLWSASAARSEEIDPAARAANDATEASPGSPKAEPRSADRPKGSPLERLKARSARARWRELIDLNPPHSFQRQPQHQALRGAPAAEAAGSTLPAQSAAPALAPAPIDAAEGIQTAPGGPSVPVDGVRKDPAPDASSGDGQSAGATQPPAAENRTGSDEDPFRPLLPTPEGGNLLSRQQPAAGIPEGADTAPYSEPVRDPRKLKKLTTIMPFDDYEPDPLLQKQDRCQNLCPRPQTANCPECANKDTPPRPGSNAVPCPECPDEVSLFDGQYLGRSFPGMGTNWLATDLWYNPLYTQDVTLERYGHTRNRFVQPFFSIAKLGVQVVGIPYQMVLAPPCSRVYPLGYYRPGDCVPYLYYQIPLNLQAAAVEAGVIAGAYYLFLPKLNP